VKFNNISKPSENNNIISYNMKKFKLLPLLLILFLSAKAQDKIINLNHDTIQCKIISIGSELIRYELNNIDGSVTGRFIPLTQVAEYTCTHQLEAHSKVVTIPENRWSLGLNAGFSTMPWYHEFFQYSSAVPDFTSHLTKGLHITASANYLIRSFWGLGVEYSFLKTSASRRSPVEYPYSIYLMDSEDCRQYINTLWASVFFQQHPDAKQKIVIRESVSAGALFLRLEDQTTNPDFTQAGYNELSYNLLLTGITFSAKLGLSAEYYLCKALSVGAGGDFIWSRLKKASTEARGSNNYSSSTDNQELNNPIKLSRVDCSFVVHYHF